MTNKTAYYTVNKANIGGKLTSSVFFEYEPGKFAQDHRFFNFNPKKNLVAGVYSAWVKVRDFIWSKEAGAYVPVSL